MALQEIIGVGSGIAGLSFSAKSRRAQRRARRLRLEINRIRNLQRRREFVANFTLAQAEALSAGVASGADLSSSGVQGVRASQATQAAVSLTENRQQQELGNQAARLDEEAAKFAFRANAIGTIGGMFS